ncbi:MAG: glycosyltransferase [Methanobacterium sp.]
MSKYKISFCIAIMNRLHHLKHTLLQNIKDNEDYDNLEFIILDYNSKDGLNDWIETNMLRYVTSKKIVYYKTHDPKSWSPSHSRNMAMKLATGGIVCNINADHFLGKNFAKYVNKSFCKDANIVLTPIDFYKTQKGYFPAKDTLGKVCLKRSDFISIRGYDESMNKHGFEDYDLVNRLEMINLKRSLIKEADYLRYIPHSDDERFHQPTANLKGLYVNYCTPSKSEILIFYKNYSFEKGCLIDNSTVNSENYLYSFLKKDHHFEYSLKESRWECGTWLEIDNNIQVEHLDENSKLLKNTFFRNGSLLTDEVNRVTYFEVRNKEILSGFWDFHHFYYTRATMEKNLKEKLQIVNTQNYGNGIVYKNFNMENPISI